MLLFKFESAPPVTLIITAIVFGQHNEVHAASSNKTIKSSKLSSRTYNGTLASSSSLTMVMEVSAYYNWNYISTALLLSDTCAVSRARSLVNSTTYPPTVNTELYHTVFIPRPGCDIQYHIDHIELSNPAFDLNARKHDISMLQVRRPVKFGNGVCGGTPVKPAWVSCDEHGPPVDYTDCYFTSFGLPYALELGQFDTPPLAPEDIETTQSPVKVLSKEECLKRRAATEDASFNETVFLTEDEFCVSTIDNHSPSCNEDWSGTLFCKYWKPPHTPQPNYHHGHEYQYEEEDLDDFEKYIAVGHRVHDFGLLYCLPDSAAYILKFGSQTYRQLFSTCEFVCSNSLPSGYQCKGNPPKSFGPVYCIPEEIPETYNVHHHQEQNYY